MIELPAFEDPKSATLYEQLRVFAEGSGWRPGSLKRRGARLERRWIMGQPGSGKVPAPGSGRLALAVFAANGADQSHGVQWRAMSADTAGLAARVWVVTDGGQITPDQVRIDLFDANGVPLALGAPLTWELGATTVRTPRPTGTAAIRTTLSRYTEGAQAFQVAALADLDALESIVHASIDNSKFQVCDYGPSPGPGLPGPCIARPPKPSEAQALRREFDTEMARRRAALAQYEQWMGVLGPLLPRL